MCFDRVAFAAWVIVRYGSSRQAAHAARGRHALGRLRSRQPLIESLVGVEARSAHPALAAALGLLDDADSRAAVAEYVARACRDSRADRGTTTIPGTEAAILALAPRAVGQVTTALSGDARVALRQSMRRASEGRLQALATRALRAWEEGWEAEALLRL